MTNYAKRHVNIIAKISISTHNQRLVKDAFKMLKCLCVKDLRMSEYAMIAQSALHSYFHCIKCTLQLENFSGKYCIQKACYRLQLCCSYELINLN
jgi:hypothetical protein